MDYNKNLKRFSLITFMLLGLFGVAFAGGDDDKKKDDKKEKNQSIIVIDSTDTDVDVEIVDQEDTLVFDDWEIPDGDFENEANKIVTLGELRGNHTTSQPFSEMKDKLVDYSFGFKKEYKVDFSIYPNPSTSQINIKAAVDADAIRITDITGREHIHSGFTNQIDVVNLPVGTYFIQLIYNDHVESRKFIKS